MIWLILFWVSVAAMVHTYLFYPVLVRLIAGNKKNNLHVYPRGDDSLPFVYVVFSVFNEENVIRQKLDSVLQSDYPQDKFRILIGSDNSTDSTNTILEEFAEAHRDKIIFRPFGSRNGKSGVLNRLTEELFSDASNSESVLILTDANVFFTKDTIYQLAKHFQNGSIGQVAANILNKGERKDGISYQEKGYIGIENQTKYYEGVCWGTMMGAFGACYAMRAALWRPIPANFLMEDFYLSMHILSEGYKAISEPRAVCYEDVSNEVREEFKRKTRIQAGNLQNLSVYWPLALKPGSLAFSLWSHKILRWMGPLFIAAALVSNIFLVTTDSIYRIPLFVQFLLLLSPLADGVMGRLGLHIQPLRFVSYFYIMNLALAKGLWVFLKGVRTSAWNPTKRNI